MTTRQPSDPKRGAQRQAAFSRRHFLRSLGVCVALPALESLLPNKSMAIHPETETLAVTSTGAPLRMAYIYFPNGAHQANWFPTGEGRGYQLGATMEPLANVKDKIQVLGNLNHEGGYPGPDGPGDHARASGGFLSGVRVRKTAGSDIYANITIDQAVARRAGHLTRFPSLELTCDVVRKAGSCDSGYSCAYQYNLAWASPTAPLTPEPNPRLVFERLFGAGPHGERQANYQLRQQEQSSVLDFVMDEARSMQQQNSARDRQRVDEYLTSLRSIEQRIQRAEHFGETPDPAVDTPAGIPESYRDYMRLVYGIMTLAFQCDATRLITFLLSNDGSNRIFPDIDVPEGHHHLTHHRNNATMMNQVAKIDRYYAEQFAWFLEQLDGTKDVDGHSLLHNSMIMYGGGIADGNRHSHNNLPIILAGAGGGTLTTGRYTRGRPQPLSNLFLGMADRMGVHDLERLGDSSGKMEGL